MFSSPTSPPNETGAASVYERVLGESFTQLDPQLRAYFGTIPTGHEGFGTGRYDEAGLSKRVLRPLFALLARPRIAFAEHAVDVPFTVRNFTTPDGLLCAVRTFHFPRATREMADTMRVVDGRLLDRIGVGGHLEVELELSVSEGRLRMRSRRFALRALGMRLPLPPVARISLEERALPGAVGVQQVTVRVTVPLLGEVYGYSGTFTYGLRPLTVTERCAATTLEDDHRVRGTHD